MKKNGKKSWHILTRYYLIKYRTLPLQTDQFQWNESTFLKGRRMLALVVCVDKTVHNAVDCNIQFYVSSHAQILILAVNDSLCVLITQSTVKLIITP
jgi:hypothetical protein